MKFTKFSFKKDLVVNTLIASVIVEQAPSLANKYFFSSSPLSGYMLNAVGAGVAIVVGMLTGKNEIGNIGIALAGADIANGMIKPMLADLPDWNGSNSMKDYSNSPLLRDYNNSVTQSNYAQYADFYSQN